jgi:hypothetical protein
MFNEIINHSFILDLIITIYYRNKYKNGNFTVCSQHVELFKIFNDNYNDVKF